MSARMLRRAIPAAALLAALAGGAPAAAQEEPAAVVRTDSTATFDFQDTDLRLVLSALAEVGGLNIVYGELPSRTVTLRTSRPVPLDRVRSLLESVAGGHGLQVREEDDVLRIVALPDTAEAAGAEGPRRPAAGVADRQLFVYSLRHARAEPIVRTLRELFRLGTGGAGEAGAARPAALSETLREQTMTAYRQAERLRRGEEPAVERVGRAAAAEGGVGVGLRAPVDIVPDPLKNAILVLAAPADYEVLLPAIEELDSRPKQVLIEVFIAEVRRNATDNVGLTAEVPVGEDGEGLGLSLAGLAAGDVALRVLGIGSVGADVVLQAISSRSDVTILSRPVILAQNNQEARVLVGDQRPFIQIFRSLPTDAAVRDQVVQYRNVGTQLLIRPVINADGYVTLSILQEVSNATAETQFGAPVINTREAETELLVRDGHTVVLGGLISHQREETRSGVPLLKDLPLLGFLFGTRSWRTTANELFIFLTPHVVKDDGDMESLQRQLREAAPELDERLPERIPLLHGPAEAPGAPADSGAGSGGGPEASARTDGGVPRDVVGREGAADRDGGRER